MIDVFCFLDYFYKHLNLYEYLTVFNKHTFFNEPTTVKHLVYYFYFVCEKSARIDLAILLISGWAPETN